MQNCIKILAVLSVFGAAPSCRSKLQGNETDARSVDKASATETVVPSKVTDTKTITSEGANTTSTSIVAALLAGGTSLYHGKTFQISPTGGVPPYSYSLTGASSSVSPQGVFTAAWKAEAANVVVTDSAGKSVTTQMTVQPGVYEFGSTTGNLDANRVITDSSNNVYVIGQSPSDLGGNFYGTRGSGAFVSKFNSAGLQLWTTQIAGSLNTPGVVFDSAGNLLIYGDGNGTNYNTRVDGGLAVPNGPCLVKVSAAGVVNFSVCINLTASATNSVFGCTPALDASGNIYVMGYTDRGNIGGNMYSHGGGAFKFETFLVKYASDGSLLWASQQGNNNSAMVLPTSLSLSVDQALVFLAGLNAGATTLGGTTYGSGGSGSFALAFSAANGTRTWATEYRSNFSTGVNGQAAKDGSGAIYLSFASGNAYGGTQFGTHGSRDAVFAKLNGASGVQIWANQLGGNGVSETGSDGFVQDASGYIYAMGTTTGTTGLSAYGTAGSTDSYVLKITPAGALSWGKQIGAGTGGQMALSAGSRIGNLQFDPTATYLFARGTTTGVAGTQLGTHGARDAFAMRLQANGTVSWLTQLGAGGTTNVQLDGDDIAIDSSGIYLAGVVDNSGVLPGSMIGNTGAGISSSFVAKLTHAGALGWLNQLSPGSGGSVWVNWAARSALTSDGNFYIFHRTDTPLPGYLTGSSGTGDAFLAKFRSDGTFE